MNDMFSDILKNFILEVLLFITIPIISTTLILTKVFDINIIISILFAIAVFYMVEKNVMSNCIEDKNKIKSLLFLSLIIVLSIIVILLFSKVDMLLLKAIIFAFIICISQHILGMVSFRKGINEEYTE